MRTMKEGITLSPMTYKNLASTVLGHRLILKARTSTSDAEEIMKEILGAYPRAGVKMQDKNIMYHASCIIHRK